MKFLITNADLSEDQVEVPDEKVKELVKAQRDSIAWAQTVKANDAKGAIVSVRLAE